MDNISVADVIRIVSDATGISQRCICRRDRHSDVAVARFMVYYVLRYGLGMSFPKVGKALNRTHATVINGITVAESWDKKNKFRDEFAIKNGTILEEIMDKIKR